MFLSKRPIFITSLMTVLIMVGCGKGNNNPAPAPAPTNPAPVNPAVPVPPGINSCPAIPGGVPLNPTNTPYFGSLQNVSTGPGCFANSNTLTLSLGFVNYGGPGSMVQNIVGSGSFIFPDLAMVFGNQSYMNTNICVSSNNTGAAGYNPGTFNMGMGTVSMTLTGVVQVPLYNPYSGYPGSYQPYPSPQTTQDRVTLNIGMSCPTYINNNRIVGCIDVRVGSSPYSP
ncbi:MAG: hypothetical protein ACKOA8_09430, partial [Deltaproteobacteria bacterium]